MQRLPDFIFFNFFKFAIYWHHRFRSSNCRRGNSDKETVFITNLIQLRDFFFFLTRDQDQKSLSYDSFSLDPNLVPVWHTMNMSFYQRERQPWAPYQWIHSKSKREMRSTRKPKGLKSKGYMRERVLHLEEITFFN